MNSPTMAPTSANGTATFMAVSIQGKASGSTTLKNACRLFAPCLYDQSTSRPVQNLGILDVLGTLVGL